MTLFRSLVFLSGSAAITLAAPAPATSGPATTVPSSSAAAAPSVKPATPPARRTPAPPPVTFDTFRVIVDRNIFNPNRTGRRERGTDDPGPHTDVISLVGTMDYDKGTFAFFDGSDPTYRRAAKLGDPVGPFRVSKISTDAVQLEREGRTFDLRVSEQLKHPDGGEWSVSAAELPRASTPSASSASPSSIPQIPSDASETLRRLMEQRQKQLKQ